MAPLARAVWAKMSVTPELSEPAVGDLFMAGEGTFQAGEGWGRESFLLAVDSLAHCHPLPPTPAFQGCSRRGPGGEGSPLGTPGTSASLGPFLHRKLLKIVFYPATMVFPVFVDSVQRCARLSCAHSGHSSLLAMNADPALCGQLREPSRKQAKCATLCGVGFTPR